METFLLHRIRESDENLIWNIQAGFSFNELNGRVKQSNINLYDVLSVNELEKMYSEADVILSHCGTGSVFGSLERKKVPFVCPRLASLGEHVDDHQLELYNYLLEKGLARKLEDFQIDKMGSTLDAPIDVSGKELTNKIWQLLNKN